MPNVCPDHQKTADGAHRPHQEMHQPCSPLSYQPMPPRPVRAEHKCVPAQYEGLAAIRMAWDQTHAGAPPRSGVTPAASFLTWADGPSCRNETWLRPLSRVGVAVCERSRGALASPPSNTGCCPNSMSLLARGVDEGRFTLLRLKGLLSSLLRVDLLRSRGAGADCTTCRRAATATVLPAAGVLMKSKDRLGAFADELPGLGLTEPLAGRHHQSVGLCLLGCASRGCPAAY